MIQLGPIDLAVLVIYLAGVVLFGIWIGRGNTSSTDFLLSSRQAAWWLVLGSIVATETSTVTFLSVPGISFAEGGDLRFLQLPLGFIVGRTAVVWLLLPLFFRGQLMTAYQVLHKRFGGMTQRVASMIFLVTRNLSDGLRLFLTAIALEKIVGAPLNTCIIVIGVLTIIYTVLGGMKSVMWNDCVQLVIYILGGCVALYVLVSRLPDGWGEITAFASETGRLRMFDFSMQWSVAGAADLLTDSNRFWAGLIGGAFLTLGSHGTDQMMVQRCLAARSRTAAGIALIASGFVVWAQFALFLFVGIGLAAFYHQFAPRTAFDSDDHVFASFIVNEFPQNVGLIGFLMAAIFSAAMSTLSSSLNSSASSVVHDWILPTVNGSCDAHRKVVEQKPNEAHSIWLSRVFTVLFGVVQIGVAIGAQSIDRTVVVNALTLAGFSAGLLLGVFALGILTKQVGQSAALSGLVVGVVTMVSLFLIEVDDKPVAFPWYAFFGSIATFAGGWLSSWLFRFVDR